MYGLVNICILINSKGMGRLCKFVSILTAVALCQPFDS